MFEGDLPKDGEASFRKFLGEVLESSGEIKITKETGLFSLLDGNSPALNG
jgi:hypothetical protein